MNEALETLIQQLADLQTHEAARTQMLQHGPNAVEAILSALAGELHLSHCQTLLRLLLEINDPRSEAHYRDALSSPDETIRAIAASGLARLGTEDALEACLATINDAPDMLHFDITPSVLALSAMGTRVLPSILPLLTSEDERTRQRAQRVLERITFAEIEREVKPPPLSDLAHREWTTLWQSNGNYRWDAPKTLRQASARQWKAWLKQHPTPG